MITIYYEIENTKPIMVMSRDQSKRLLKMAEDLTPNRILQDSKAVRNKPPSGKSPIHVTYTAANQYAREVNSTSSRHLLFEPSKTAIQEVKYPLRKRPLSAKATLTTTSNLQTLQLEENDYIKQQRQQTQKRESNKEEGVHNYTQNQSGKTSRCESLPPKVQSAPPKVQSSTSKHLLFEPVILPKQLSSPSLLDSNSIVHNNRRPQSAKARLEYGEKSTLRSNHDTKTTRFSNNKFHHSQSDSSITQQHVIRQRPQSAKFAKEKDSAIQRDARRRPTSAKPWIEYNKEREPIKAKTLEIGLKSEPCRDKPTVERGDSAAQSIIVAHFPYKLAGKTEEPKYKKEEKERENLRRLPKGIAALGPFLTEDIPIEWCGVDPKSCLVFLPSLLYQDGDLPVLPPVQEADDVIPHVMVPAPLKPFDPKRLFHYTGDKSRSESVTGDSRIYSSDGKVLHDNSKYTIGRTKDVIRKEIDDLEKLLQGIGRAESDNIVVQYQHDINVLQREVRKTLRQARHIKGPVPEEEPPDLFGLRQFYREHDEVIARIKQRREVCLQELYEYEAELGMHIQREVMKEYLEI
ncbi:uncharacterized protein LOC144435615 [Glandiceps talaboti]